MRGQNENDYKVDDGKCLKNDSKYEQMQKCENQSNVNVAYN